MCAKSWPMVGMDRSVYVYYTSSSTIRSMCTENGLRTSFSDERDYSYEQCGICGVMLTKFATLACRFEERRARGGLFFRVDSQSEDPMIT